MVDAQAAAAGTSYAAERLFSWPLPANRAGAAPPGQLLAGNFSLLSADIMPGN
ncbi:hypothetical protein D3C75_1098570 [compost metagenome]